VEKLAIREARADPPGQTLAIPTEGLQIIRVSKTKREKLITKGNEANTKPEKQKGRRERV